MIAIGAFVFVVLVAGAVTMSLKKKAFSYQTAQHQASFLWRGNVYEDQGPHATASRGSLGRTLLHHKLAAEFQKQVKLTLDTVSIIWFFFCHDTYKPSLFIDILKLILN